jgi:hypothetical protein
MGVMSTRARPQAVWRGIRCRIFRTSGGFRSHFRLAEAHLSRRVLTSTFRRRPVGNRSRKRRAPAAGRGKAGPGTPGFVMWPWADELLQGFSSCRHNVHTEERPPGRHVSSTPAMYSCDLSQLALCLAQLHTTSHQRHFHRAGCLSYTENLACFTYPQSARKKVYSVLV